MKEEGVEERMKKELYLLIFSGVLLFLLPPSDPTGQQKGRGEK